MADVAIDPFSDHDKTDSHPDTGENIPLTPEGAIRGSTWKPECKQETSFGGTSLREEVLRERVKGVYQKLSEKIG